MNFISNAIRNIQTTLLGVAPLVIGGYMTFQGIKSGDVQKISEGIIAMSGGAGLIAAKDGSKSGTAVVPR